MRAGPRIPEISQRDRFIRRAVAQRTVYAIAGEEGLARVPSRRFRDREVTLFWSSRTEAERWAPVVASNPRIKELPLAAVMTDVLPALSGLHRYAGTDWGAEPVEAEVDPLDLCERLRNETLDTFVAKARLSRKVYMLEDASGPALLVAASRPDTLMLPCWSQRAAAEERIEGPWRNMTAIEFPLETFLDRTLRWLTERGYLVSPDHWLGSAALELQPGEVARRLGRPPAG
jgi:hypothetical protein